MSELFKGKSVETGAEIVGYLVECKGQIDPGQAFICPEVRQAFYSGIGHGETLFSLGPFIRVDPNTVEPVRGEAEEAGKNTCFEFLYRDSSNYKTWNTFVLAGRLSMKEIEEIISCGDGENFIAEQVGLDHAFPGDGSVTDDDHAWCEFEENDTHGFSMTDADPTTDITAKQLLENFRAAKGNWDDVKYAPDNLY